MREGTHLRGICVCFGGGDLCVCVYMVLCENADMCVGVCVRTEGYAKGFSYYNHFPTPYLPNPAETNGNLNEPLQKADFSTQSPVLTLPGCS